MRQNVHISYKELISKKSELRKIFLVKAAFAHTEETALTIRALFQSTSIISNFVHPKYIAVKTIPKLLIKPFFPEPQKDPYWISVKRGILVNIMDVAKIWMSTLSEVGKSNFLFKLKRK